MDIARRWLRLLCVSVLGLSLLGGCQSDDPSGESPGSSAGDEAVPLVTQEGIQDTPMYAHVELDADLSELSGAQREVIRLLIRASDHMDTLFWRQSFGDGDALVSRIDRPAVRRYAEINYGPWDRLHDNRPFLEGYGPKPPGAQFYPADMSDEEFHEAAEENEALSSLYTLVRRGEDGAVRAVPYSEAYADHLRPAAELLREAAEVSENPSLTRYLELRAEALLSDEYRPSDMAWMELEHNRIDAVIGPIETYEDQRFGYKAAFEGFVLLKDPEWSQRLARYTKLLPDLQERLPVPAAYRQEEPGRESELNVYDALYYAGDANAGAKTIAINLPNDEQVRTEKGSRRLQLRNAMAAKFEKILGPIGEMLLAPAHRKHLTFEAFFANTMFHEVAHGLGVSHTLTDEDEVSDETVRSALRDRYTTIEEGKADVLGLFMIRQLEQMNELEGSLRDHYVTFFASIFRSIRFGTASAHGRANLIRFNFFREQGAFSRDPESGTYRIHPEPWEAAVDSLSSLVLRVQGDGDYERASELVERYGQMGDTLARDLERLGEADIPVDIVFEQGPDVLGLATDGN